MATWIAHLRIAENILRNGRGLDKTAFVSGNIAPDAGVPNEDWSIFSPPSDITHWKDETGKINADNFFNRYLTCPDSQKDIEYFSFLLGYYTHLLADIEWSKFYSKKKEEPLYKENLGKDPKFIWRIKEDWYGQDFEYLKKNEQSIFFTCFINITEVKDYLDYFPKGAFTNRFKYIREMYLNNYKKSEREFIYLTRQEMDDFVESAASSIESKLSQKLI
jgi:hypothetical protein